MEYTACDSVEMTKSESENVSFTTALSKLGLVLSLAIREINDLWTARLSQTSVIVSISTLALS